MHKDEVELFLNRAKNFLDGKIEEKAKLPLVHPFDFHILTNEELKTWIKIYDFKYENISSYL